MYWRMEGISKKIKGRKIKDGKKCQQASFRKQSFGFNREKGLRFFLIVKLIVKIVCVCKEFIRKS